MIKRPQKSQRQKFIDTARELGCDEDEEAFRDKLRRIARQQVKSKGGHDGKKTG